MTGINCQANFDAGLPERSLIFNGRLGSDRSSELCDAITKIANSWVADDIVVDLIDVETVDNAAIAALFSAAEYARQLGHRVIVHARGSIANMLAPRGSASLVLLT